VPDDVVIEPMTEALLLWRCLHGGPLARHTIDQWPSDGQVPWERYRKRHIPLLARLTRTYGACAIVARDGDRIVGQLRFYPKAVADMEGAGGLCLQQDYPSGPADGFADRDFPALARIQDKTLAVHCLMTGSPQQEENPYQRKGIGTRMVRALIRWAEAEGWEHIEAMAFEDLPIIYQITGSAGHTFWEKAGFSLVDRRPHPDLRGHEPFVTALEEQARSVGMSPERAKDQLVMRLELRDSRLG
jgi:GNAT superfamily N-acetyltransferase